MVQRGRKNHRSGWRQCIENRNKGKQRGINKIALGCFPQSIIDYIQKICNGGAYLLLGHGGALDMASRRTLLHAKMGRNARCPCNQRGAPVSRRSTMVVVAIAQDVLQDTEVARSIVIFGHGFIVTGHAFPWRTPLANLRSFKYNRGLWHDFYLCFFWCWERYSEVVFPQGRRPRPPWWKPPWLASVNQAASFPSDPKYEKAPWRTG